jgi:hypothetical protein
MDGKLFLELTASDDWLTAAEIVARLGRGAYWTEAYGAGPPELRLAHVETQLRTLRTARQGLAFVAVDALALDGTRMRLWKQQARIQAKAGPSSRSVRAPVVRIAPTRQRGVGFLEVDRRRVRIGMVVLGADGEPVGTVKEIHDAALLVDRPLHRDVYVPYYAIERLCAGRLILSVPHDQVDAMYWPSPPLLEPVMN